MGRGAERVATAGAWCVRLDPSRRDGLARLRCHDHVRALVLESAIWLSGACADEALVRLLDGLPGGERFEVDAQGDCRVPGHYLPVAQLPAGEWQPVQQLLAVELPTVQLPVPLHSRVPLRIVRGAAMATPNVLCTELSRFAEWIGGAAEVRYQSLRMAVSAEGQALVHGVPLPSLPGAVAVEQHGVAVAAGFRLEPAVAPSLAAKVLALNPGDLAWFAEGRDCVIVPADQFVAVLRSSVRMTHRHLTDKEWSRDG